MPRTGAESFTMTELPRRLRPSPRSVRRWRGFVPIARTEPTVVNVGRLAAFEAGASVGPDELRAQGLVRRRGPVKILGEGTLDRALTVNAHAFSEKARAAIEGAGGRAVVLE